MKASAWILIIGMACMTYACMVYYPKWNLSRTEATLSWDVSGYYLYLPALFIYNDIKDLKFKDSIDQKYYPASSAYQTFMHPSGHQVMKYTAGLAILYSPFFLIAHLLAELLGYTPDGYSKIYQFFISLGSLIWAFIGLYFLRKVLLRYFEDTSVALAMCVLIFATNYFDYASITGAMSHNYLFTLYVLLIGSTDNFYRSNKNKWFYTACIICGMLVLIRPTEILSVLILAFWKTNSVGEIKNRVVDLIGKFPLLIKGALFFMLCPLIQIFYWKYVSGEWIVYSYQEQGFSWLEGHHILRGVFSYQAGWLVYTPVMILIFVAIGYAIINKIKYSWYLISFVLLSLYITFAWDEWTYGGSLSARALVQHYPVMIWLLPPLFNKLFFNIIVKTILVAFILICSYYNLWLTHHAHKGGIYEAGMMNKHYFWHTLFKSKNDLEAKKLLDTNEPMHNFSNENSFQIVQKEFVDSVSQVADGRSIVLNDSLITVPKIKVKVLIKATLKEWDIWQMAQLVIQYKYQDHTVKPTMLRMHRYLNDNDEKWIELVTRTPKLPFDRMQISVWNPSSKPVIVKQMEIYGEK